MAIITGNNLSNVLFGTGLADTINGLGGSDQIFGFGGNDRLDGGFGADTMQGGSGNDLYIVDALGDNIIEYAGQGIDRINSVVSIDMGLGGRINVENLLLTGFGAINGTGNALDNTINGNSAKNVIRGAGGNDILSGFGGVDKLFGGAGNDFLSGGTGADTMRGELGSDTYIVDHFEDRVIDFGGGIDRIVSLINTGLNIEGRLTVENLTLTGNAIAGGGNALGNTIIGNNLGNNLGGAAGDDVLSGGGGNDSLFGGLGIDKITTGAGRDEIFFHAPPGLANFDQILDYAPAFDTIKLQHLDFTGLTLGTFLPAADFVIGAAAADTSDRIIYNPLTGNLFFDVDGTGSAVQLIFADLPAGLAMSAADFRVI